MDTLIRTLANDRIGKGIMGRAKSQVVIFSVVVLFVVLIMTISASADITISVNIESKNVVYDPVSQIATSNTRTTAFVGGVSIYADKVQVDFKNKLLRASGNVVIGSYITGQDAVINFEYKEAGVYVDGPGSTPLTFDFNHSTFIPVPKLRNVEVLPEFVNQPDSNVLHCRSLHYQQPGKFTISHAKYIDPDGEMHYASELISDSPDIFKTRFISDIVVKTSKNVNINTDRLSNKYHETQKWYRETESGVLWLSNSFGRTAWVDLYGQTDPQSGRTYFSPEFNYNATVGNRNLNLYVERSQEKEYEGISLAKYTDSWTSKGVSTHFRKDNYFTQYDSSQSQYSRNSQSGIYGYFSKKWKNRMFNINIRRNSTRYNYDGESQGASINYTYESNGYSNNSYTEDTVSAQYSIYPRKTRWQPFLVSLQASGNVSTGDTDRYYKDQSLYSYVDAGRTDLTDRTGFSNISTDRWYFSLRPSLRTGTKKLKNKLYFTSSATYSMDFNRNNENYWSSSTTKYYRDNEYIREYERESFYERRSNDSSYQINGVTNLYRQIGQNSAIGVYVNNWRYSGDTYADIYPSYSYTHRGKDYFRVEYDYDMKTSRWEDASLLARIQTRGNYRYSGRVSFGFEKDEISYGYHTLDRIMKKGVISMTYDDRNSMLSLQYQSDVPHGESRGGALDEYESHRGL